MAKARKMKSGNWNAQVFDYRDEKGVVHFKYFTASTRVEAEYLATQYKKKRARRKRVRPEDLTVREAVESYIEDSAVLSPTTLSSYKKILSHSFQSIMEIKLSDLTDELVQNAINTEMRRCGEKTGRPISAKTVKNEWGLISSSLRSRGYTFRIKLPKTQKHLKEYPEPEDVLAAIVGSDAELPFLLAMWLSFSMSEIRGLNCSDIKNGCITINRVRVDVDGVVTEKQNAKVETRLRRHQIPDYIQTLIDAQESYRRYLETGIDEPLIQLNQYQIYYRWRQISEAHNFNISFHDLRHMNASIMLMLNVPEKYAMERGGWKTPHVMKSVYQHTFSSERIKVDRAIDEYFVHTFEKIKPETP